MNVVALGLVRVKMFDPTVFAPKSDLKLLADWALTVLSEFILINEVAPGFVKVKIAEPTVLAPKSVLNSEADLAVIVFAEFILMNEVDPGSVNLNKLAPTVVAPKFVSASEAVVALVPPLAIATTPVMFVALPLKLAVIVPALKLPDVSLETIVLTVLALVALLATVKVALVVAFAENEADPVRPIPDTPNVKDASFMSVVIAKVPEVGRVRVDVPVEVKVTKWPPENDNSEPDEPMLSNVLLLLSKPFFTTNRVVVAIIDSLSSINYFLFLSSYSSCCYFINS
jgi:hypothetical protein